MLVAAGIAAVALQSTSTGPVAARVGTAVISDSILDREVAAIEAQPAYRAALSQASTVALAAPVSPLALAAANGDPDDLRVTFAPVNGASTSRAVTLADLRATVLNRLIYVEVVGQLLAARAVTPTAAEVAQGREEARFSSGTDARGVSLFDRLPAWYQHSLAGRGAAVTALERSLVGDGGITESSVTASYALRRPTDFTTVCLRVAISGPSDLAAARAAVAAGSSGSRSAGCAPMSQWAPDVAADVAAVPVGTVAPAVRRGGRIAVLKVLSRTTLPISAVEGPVRAALSARYTDAINSVVEDQLALVHVAVAARYGTYLDSGILHSVLPPDALTPPTASPSDPAPLVQQTSAPQQLDPFD